MIHIKEAIVVEGKYDKEQLKKITDAPILCTHGFQLYQRKDIVNAIRQFAKTTGILILTDSDSAGFRIRNYLKSCLGADCIIKNAYIPSLPGKEKRKDKPGKEGLLGVEGMTEDTLTAILRSAATVQDEAKIIKVTKTDFYQDGLTGRADSKARRDRLIRMLQLPPRISCNALLSLLNQLGGQSVYREAIRRLSL